MGVLISGLFQSVKGTVGNLVTSNRNGVNYVRVKSASVRTNQSEAQLTHQAKFALAKQFVTPLSEAIKLGDPSVKGQPLAKGQTVVNNVAAFVMKSAIAGVYPNLEVDYPKVELCKGNNLCQAEELAAKLENGSLNVTWTHSGTSRFGKWSDNDTVVLVVYNLNNQQVGLSEGEATRKEKKVSMPIPGHFAGEKLVAYLFLISEDETRTSQSQYLGTFDVPAAV